MIVSQNISQIAGQLAPSGPMPKTGPVFSGGGTAAPPPAVWDPRTITSGTVLLWLDPSQGVTMDGSNQVSQWDDQSASNFDFVQADTAQMLVYNATAINGTPGMAGGPSRRMSYTGTFATTGGRYLFAVIKYYTNPTQSVNTMCEFDSGAYGTVAPYLNSYCYDGFGRSLGRAYPWGGEDTTVAFVFTDYTNVGAWSSYYNGVEFYTEVPGGVLAWPASELWIGSKTTQGLWGYYGDFIVVDSAGAALSPTDFNYIVDGLKTKAGIP